MEIFILPSIQARWQFNSLILSLLASPHPSTLLSPVWSHHFARLLSLAVWLHPYALRGYMGSTPYLLTPQWGSDTCEKTPRRPARISIPHRRCDCLHTARPDGAWQRRWALEFSCQRVIPLHGCMESVICSNTPPPPSPDAFRNRPWEVLASIRWSSEELGRMRPSGYFCLLSPFLYRKAGEVEMLNIKTACKLESQLWETGTAARTEGENDAAFKFLLPSWGKKTKKTPHPRHAGV